MSLEKQGVIFLIIPKSSLQEPPPPGAPFSDNLPKPFRLSSKIRKSQQLSPKFITDVEENAAGGWASSQTDTSPNANINMSHFIYATWVMWVMNIF